MSSTAAKSKMKTHSDKFEEFVANEERRRLYERESLAFDASEMVAFLMEQRKMNKAQLARAIGKSRAYVTQLLSGSRNMTIHTLADLGFALGYRFELKARECKRNEETTEEVATHSIYRFCKRQRYVREAERADTPLPSHVSGCVGA
jgi:transcriptional regulator with XRE-family HTH domain